MTVLATRITPARLAAGKLWLPQTSLDVIGNVYANFDLPFHWHCSTITANQSGGGSWEDIPDANWEFVVPDDWSTDVTFNATLETYLVLRVTAHITSGSLVSLRWLSTANWNNGPTTIHKASASVALDGTPTAYDLTNTSSAADIGNDPVGAVAIKLQTTRVAASPYTVVIDPVTSFGPTNRWYIA